MSLKKQLGAFPVLDTQRLRLREPRPQEDAPAHFLLWSDPEAIRFTPDAPVTSVEESVACLSRIRSWFCDTRYTIGWAVTSREDDRYISGIGFFQFLGHRFQIAEVSVVLAREYWNRGLGTESLRAAVTFGFGWLWLKRIQMVAHPDHAAAARVAAKVGFKEEGILRQWIYNERTQDWDDQRLFSILRCEQPSAELSSV